MKIAINWNQAFRQSASKPLGVCRRYVNDLYLAEDILQESFILAIQKENLYRKKGSLEDWINCIVINISITKIRSREVKKSLNLDFNKKKNNYYNLLTVDKLNEKQALSQILNYNFNHQELLQAIDHLSMNHKMVFNMFVIDHFSHYQISEILNISVKTSKLHLLRARKKIALLLLNEVDFKKTKINKSLFVSFALFFGFGNFLLDNQIKKSFKNFEIQPEKPFNSHHKDKIISNIDTNFYTKAKEFFELKVVISVLGLLFLISSVIYLTSIIKNT